MSSENALARRVLVWTALVFSALTVAVSWWHWWTFQYSSFDLAFYVQALWLALRGKWTVSLLNVPLMGNHAEPIVFLLTPLFAICPHPMLFVVAQTLAFASMPFTAWRIGRQLGLEPYAALFLAAATLLAPAAFSIAIYEFHPEALAAPLLLLLYEARLAQRRGLFWLWFLAVLGVKENMAPLLVLFCGMYAVVERDRDRGWQLHWNVMPALVAMGWLLLYGKVISPALNAGNVDYLQLYSNLGSSPGDILRKFFTEPQRLGNALRDSLGTGNMLPALLLPFMLLPLLRPRWLLIAAPLLLQHLLSFRSSEWSLGAHYPAPFLALFWIATAESLVKFRAQTAIAGAVLAACVTAHFRFGASQELKTEIPSLADKLEEREWKAQMLSEIPDNAAVTASLGFLSHLAKRENVISLHHILKGLKTLSTATYTAPPPGDAVLIDYADRLTFNAEAGYYHPRSHIDATHSFPSSDQLLNGYLRQARWQTRTRNSVALLRRGEPATAPAFAGAPVPIDAQTTLVDMQIPKRLPGGWKIRLSWKFSGERERYPWLMLVLSDGHHLFPIVKGICAPEAGAGEYTEEWNVVFPTWMHAGYHSAFAEFYDGSQAIWLNKMPPTNQTYLLKLIPLGGMELKPGDFTQPTAQ
jgi:uncharacterized membrane protein